MANSSVEVECQGMAYGVYELLWVKNVQIDVGIKHLKPMNFHCDNKVAIEIFYYPIQHDRT